MERKLEDIEKSMKRSNDKQLKIEHECCEKVCIALILDYLCYTVWRPSTICPKCLVVNFVLFQLNRSELFSSVKWLNRQPCLTPWSGFMICLVLFGCFGPNFSLFSRTSQMGRFWPNMENNASKNILFFFWYKGSSF